MQKHNDFVDYIKNVCSQIRIKQVHSDIEQELMCHMQEQKQTYIDNGTDDRIAIQKTIEDMGDPIIIGGQLDQTHRPKPNKKLVLFASIMIAFAVFMQLFLLQTPYYWISLSIGVALCFAFYYMDYTFLAKYAWLLFGLFFVLGLAILLTNLSSFVLLFVPAYCGILYKMKSKRYLGLGISFAVMLAPVLGIMLLPSFIMALVIGLVCFILLLIAVVKEWFGVKKGVGMLLVIMPIAIFIILLFNNLADFQLYRLTSMFAGDSFIAQSTNEMMQGVQAMGESHTINASYQLDALRSSESILVYILANYGAIPTAAICAGIITFVIVMFYIARKQKNTFAAMLSYGCAITYCVQCVIFLASNLFAHLGFFNGTPFLFGSNSMVITNMILLGVFLSASKWDGIVSEKALFKRNTVAQSSR